MLKEGAKIKCVDSKGYVYITVGKVYELYEDQDKEDNYFTIKNDRRMLNYYDVDCFEVVEEHNFLWAMKQRLQDKIVVIDDNWALTKDCLNLEEINGELGRAVTTEDVLRTDWKIVEEKKTLSDKIQCQDGFIPNCYVTDVKEFIKTVKKRIKDFYGETSYYDFYDLFNIIDEEAGNDLI